MISSSGTNVLKETKTHVNDFGNVVTEFIFIDDVQPEQLIDFFKTLDSNIINMGNNSN